MAGKIQKQDVKTEAELIAAGATKADLIQDTQIYVSASGINKTLGDAIIDGDIGSGGSAFDNYTNLLYLDSSYNPTDGTSANAESTVGTWGTYADATGVSPVDMDGGSPVTTIARSTSSPLNGAASFLIDLGSGSSRQGEGARRVVYIPPGRRGKSLNFYGIYTSSGTIAVDDIRLFAYDITNTTVITPSSITKIDSAGPGTFNAQFAIPSTTASIRLGFHVARTSTGSLSFKVDDMFFGEIVTPTSTSIGSWTSYTPTYTGFGTVSGSNAWYKVVGDTLQVQGYVTTGSPTATEARISLPGSYTVSSTNAGASTSLAGDLLHASAGSIGALYIYKVAGNSYVTMGYRDGSTNGLSSLNGSATLHSTTRTSFRFEVPI